MDRHKLAFETAEKHMGITAILEPEDMVQVRLGYFVLLFLSITPQAKPDELSVMTYVSNFRKFEYFEKVNEQEENSNNVEEEKKQAEEEEQKKIEEEAEKKRQEEEAEKRIEEEEAEKKRIEEEEAEKKRQEEEEAKRIARENVRGKSPLGSGGN